jgi:hypothetical protein
MKKILFLFLLLFSIHGFTQTLNDYQYVIVPIKFNDFDINNQFRLNTITKLNLEKLGFIVYYENSNIPVEILSKRCDILNVEVLKGKKFLFTSVFINFFDCNGNVIFQSELGKTKEKDFQKGYPIALEEAFQSLFRFNYKYTGKSRSSEESIEKNIDQEGVVGVGNQKSKLPNLISEATEYSEVLYAQPTLNGFQLVDSSPKVVFKLFRTDSPSMFLAQKGNKNGVVLLKDGSWFFEYQENEKVVSEKIEIKF